jgi:HSP20 family protein
MSNYTLEKPIREMMSLREAMDQLFDQAFTRPRGANGVSVIPAIDVYETPDDVVVRANLPGLNSDDVQISVTSGLLILRGEFKEKNEPKQATYHILERRTGAFERSVMLPSDVQTEKAKAHFENGVLTITLPKVETVKPKTITVKAK